MILFFSDAHIGTGEPEDQEKRKQLLLEFLDHYAPRLEKMFILGDLFDFWFEWQHVILKRYFPILCKLRELVNRGVEIHFLAGNHDFALSRFLSDEVGIQIHLNDYQLTYDGKQFNVMHGDGLAPADWGYRILKKIFRSRFNQKLFSLLHPDFAFYLAHKSSHTSRNYSGRRWDVDSWAYLKTAEDVVQQGSDYVLLAHNHEPILQSIGDGIYVNTGDWMRYFSYAVYENGSMTLKYWGKPFLQRSESTYRARTAS